MVFAFKAIEGIFSIIFIIAIGYVLNKKGWFDDKSSTVIANLVTKISLPLYMIVSLTKNFTRDGLIKMAPDMLLPVASMFTAYLIGKLCSKFFNIVKGRRGVFATNFFIANTMFIGLPVNLALFGEKSIPAVMLYYMVNTLFFWTLGVKNIVQDAAPEKEANKGFFSKEVWKKVFSPPLIGFFIALLLVLLNFRLPIFLERSFQYVGNLTTPLSLIFIGIEMSKITFKDIGLDKDLLLGLVGRFLVCPLCVLLFVPFIDVTPLSVQVFTMQATMPAMTQMAIVAKTYGGDSKYAAALSFLTILFGIIVLPIYMYIVNSYI